MRIAGRPTCASNPHVVCALRYGSNWERSLPPNATPASCTSSGACRRVTPATTGCQTLLPRRNQRFLARRAAENSSVSKAGRSTRAHDPKASITVIGDDRVSTGRPSGFQADPPHPGFGGADGNRARRIVPRVVRLVFLRAWSDPPDAGRAFAPDCRSDPTFRLRRARRRPAERKVSSASQWLRPPRQALRCEACGCTNRRS